MSDIIIITGYVITRKMNFTAGRQSLDKVTILSFRRVVSYEVIFQKQESSST